jgi:hypothetical protein
MQSVIRQPGTLRRPSIRSETKKRQALALVRERVLMLSVCTENLNPNVVVMKSAKNRV